MIDMRLMQPENCSNCCEDEYPENYNKCVSLIEGADISEEAVFDILGDILSREEGNRFRLLEVPPSWWKNGAPIEGLRQFLTAHGGAFSYSSLCCHFGFTCTPREFVSGRSGNWSHPDVCLDCNKMVWRGYYYDGIDAAITCNDCGDMFCDDCRQRDLEKFSACLESSDLVCHCTNLDQFCSECELEYRREQFRDCSECVLNQCLKLHEKNMDKDGEIKSICEEM